MYIALTRTGSLLLGMAAGWLILCALLWLPPCTEEAEPGEAIAGNSAEQVSASVCTAGTQDRRIQAPGRAQKREDPTPASTRILM